jgi:hypothetical protein
VKKAGAGFELDDYGISIIKGKFRGIYQTTPDS